VIDAALAQVATCVDAAALDDLRVHWLGRKGVLTEQLKSLGLAAAERPAAGARINEAKTPAGGSRAAARGPRAPAIDAQPRRPHRCVVAGRGEPRPIRHPRATAHRGTVRLAGSLSPEAEIR
jgi:hypothetical protein